MSLEILYTERDSEIINPDEVIPFYCTLLLKYTVPTFSLIFFRCLSRDPLKGFMHLKS